MAFIQLTLENPLNQDDITTSMINTDFIVHIDDSDKGPVLYWTSLGFEKETTIRVVKNYNFNELKQLLNCVTLPIPKIDLSKELENFKAKNRDELCHDNQEINFCIY